MAVKNISTRMKICGSTEKCTGGHSAVEQSGYISRETMYSEYDGKTYYPKYADYTEVETMPKKSQKYSKSGSFSLKLSA